MAVRIRVCLRWYGSLGSVNGSAMIWAVNCDGRLWVRQAEENVACVVGIKAIKSYPLKRGTLALIYSTGLRTCQLQMNINNWPIQSLSHYLCQGLYWASLDTIYQVAVVVGWEGHRESWNDFSSQLPSIPSAKRRPQNILLEIVQQIVKETKFWLTMD